jgi:hypothetical protein
MIFSASADTVTVGTSTSSNCAPFGCSDGGNWDYFQIYSASAFSGPIKFDVITFLNTVHPGQTLYGDYVVSFSTTTDPVGVPHSPTLSNTGAFFSGTFGSVPGSVTGPIPTTISIFGAAYTYDPSAGNLVMEVKATNQPHPYAGLSAQYLNADQGGPMSRFVSGDGFLPFNDNIGLVTEFALVPATAVPAPIPGAGIPGMLAMLGAMLFWYKKTDRRSGPTI